jgi:hypothetical protein
MKTLFKVFLILFIIFLIPCTYLQYLIYENSKMLEEDSKPFVAACNSSDGCIIEPKGWHKEDNGIYEKDMMEYKANKYQFRIVKHIATDTYLLVQGGKNTALTIEHLMDGDIDWNNLTIIK